MAVRLPAERKEVSVSRKILAGLVGTYQFERGTNMVVSLVGDQLMTKLGDQGAIPIFAESESLFFPKTVDAELEFGRDEKGDAAYLILHQGGRDQKALRISAEVPSTPERKEVKVAAELLGEYQGTYHLAPEFDIEMTVEGDRLMTQATGQEKFQLYAESDARFFAKVVDAQIEFVRDKDGKVVSLILHQGGRDLAAPRLH